MEHLKAATEQAGGRNRYWFTAHEFREQYAALHDPIWQKATSQGNHAIVETIQ